MESSPPQRRLDRHFRWRGQQVSRLEAFSDAVFALVIALLFLQTTPPTDLASLAAAMKSLLPFAATFALLALIWGEHYLFFRRYDLGDGPTIAANFALLFLVLFYAYPLKFVFTWIASLLLGEIAGVDPAHAMAGGHTNPIWFYSTGVLAIYAVYGLLYGRALALRRELQLNATETFLTRSAILQCGLYAAIAGLSLLLAALWQPGAAGLVYFAVGPAMAWHGFWQGRRVARLATAA